MARVDWYFARTGPGQVGEIAAHSAPSQKALKKIAHRIGDRAASHLDTRAVHRTGDSQITVTKGDLDWYVNLEDPDGGAAGIEFGWSRLHKSGTAYGSDGLGVLRDAVGDTIRKGVIL